MKVAVIGAGASGLMCAINIKENNKVILIDGNSKIAAKIMITGNGKCNYWNDSIELSKYNTTNPDILDNILRYKEETLESLYKIGIFPTIKNGYYYPHSETSATIRTLFEYQLKRKNIETKLNFKVAKIEKSNNEFIITSTDNQTIIVDKVVIATGSKAQEKTGSDGSGYNLLKHFNHQTNPILPSLSPMVIDEKHKLRWKGIRTHASVSLYIDNEFINSEEGEVQLTDYGISGICVFNLSSKASNALYKNKKVSVTLDLLPEITDFENYLTKRLSDFPDFTIERVLESLLHYELVQEILYKCNINLDTLCLNISKKDIKMISEAIKQSSYNISSILGFDRAQVCRGGVPLSEINPQTMESKLIDNLYITGEVLDVDGICGGYNLAFAFITGYIAGKEITHDSHTSN